MSLDVSVKVGRVVEEDFYKRSYRRNIDIFNAKREMINYVYEYFTGKVLK